MAGFQRIRGQEVTVQVIGPSGDIKALADVRSFSVTPKFSKLEEQYLGDPSKRYDEIFDGVDFEMEMHLADPNVTAFVQAIKQRAQDRKSQTKFNISAVLTFVERNVQVQLIDCYFENMPINFGSRSDYGTFKVSGSCSDISSI